MSTDNKPFCIIFSRKPISECFKKTWQVTICSRCEFEKSNKHSGNKCIITYGRFSNFSSTKYRFIMTFLETVCCWSYGAVVIDITILIESHLCFGIINLFFKSIENNPISIVQMAFLLCSYIVVAYLVAQDYILALHNIRLR